MSTTVNWSKLVAQGRVKAPGIPWTDEEFKAIREDGIKPDDVRLGILTKEAVADADASEKINGKQLVRMTKIQLIELAKKLEIDFAETEVKRSDLISVISIKAKQIEEEKLTVE